MSNIRKLLVVQPPEHLDAAAVPAFAAALSRATDTADLLVLDCAGVSFMDSAGVDAIRDAGRTLAARGARLTLRNAPGQIRLMIDLADDAD